MLGRRMAWGGQQLLWNSLESHTAAQQNWHSLLVHLARQYCTGDASVTQLSATSSLLRNLKNGAEVYLIGTAHVSAKSAEEVREMTVLSQMGMPGSMQSKLLSAGLSGMYSLLRAVGMEPGGEFKAGIEEAERIGAAIVCGDREQHVTAQRISQHFRLQDFLRLMSPQQQAAGLMSDLSGSLEDMVERLKTREAAAQMSAYLRSINPGVACALVDERDEILARALLQQRGKVVGVVGLAHLEGIEAAWRRAMRAPAGANAG